MPTALITGKTNIPKFLPIFKRLQDTLQKSGFDSIIITPDDPIPCDFDVIFCVGGDGNFVGTVRRYLHFEKPVIGINAGTLGFLPNISPDEIETKIPALLEDNVIWTRRLVVSGKCDNGTRLHALNEFLFANNRRGLLSHFTISINHHIVMKTRSDGLLITTPTGSTAYNLSAGGPIVLPDMELLVITPVCSHVLGERPLVVGLNNHIEIINHSDLECTIWADGQDSISFNAHGTFTLTDPYFVNTHPMDSAEFFSSLAQKLGWNSTQFK